MSSGGAPQGAGEAGIVGLNMHTRTARSHGSPQGHRASGQVGAVVAPKVMGSFFYKNLI